MRLPIYMDYHATTPVDPRVVEAMKPFFYECFGNVASQHCFGKPARAACEKAREQVAQLIGARADEIVFTSGATESNNLALKGVAEARAPQGRHIISCVTEHKSVLDTLQYLQTKGFDVTFLPVDHHGMVSVEDVRAHLRLGPNGKDRTILVSLMGANNEIGVLHPIKAIGRMLKEERIVFHVDAAQTVGKVMFEVRDACISLMSISGHKMYGPKGIGALYINKSCDYLKLQKQMHGGGQENGLRAGTLPVPLVVGLGAAAEIACEELSREVQELAVLRDRLWAGIQSLGDCYINGHPTERLPGSLNVTFKYLDGERLILGLKDVALSSTSACSSGMMQPSYVLTALGRSADDAFASLRFGLGRFSTREEVDYVVQCLHEIVPRLRRTSARLQEVAASHSR